MTVVLALAMAVVLALAVDLAVALAVVLALALAVAVAVVLSIPAGLLMTALEMQSETQSECTRPHPLRTHSQHSVSRPSTSDLTTTV